jgi:uncharacterized protein DUF6463
MLEADLIRMALAPIMVVGLIIIAKLRVRKAGRILMLIGVLHVLAGGYVGREFLVQIFRDGFFGEGDSNLGSTPPDMGKELIFWFLIWGPFTYTLGHLLSWIESKGGHPPAFIGWQLFIANLIAALLVPKGGFWWAMIPALMIIRSDKRPASLA